MIPDGYVWLVWWIAFLVPWAALLVAFPQHRKPMLWGSAHTGAAQRRPAMGNGRRRWIRLILWGLVLNLVWEFAHSPLYADHGNGWGYVAWTRFHCTLGDVLILAGAFATTAVMLRSWHWLDTRGSGAATVFVGLGLAYTVWSEWFNTAVREAWAYAPAMPLVFGVGLSPLLQWLVIPTLLVWILRRRPASELSKGETA